MKRILTASVFLIMVFVCQAQTDRRLINGLILSSDSLEPLYSTHIISKMTRLGTISDFDGGFHIYVSPPDTLWVSNVGFKRLLVAVDSTIMANDSILVMLERDTTQLDEVEVIGFYDYRTFKHLIATMPTRQTPDFYTVSEELTGSLIGIRPREGNDVPVVTASPIQALYDAFNKKSRRERRLIRNRREYNDALRREGRFDELLPDTLEFINNE